MPSVKQVIAEIQLAPDLPPSHKAKAVQIIRDAEERLKLKRPNMPRRIVQARGLVTLGEWEEKHGPLMPVYIKSWIVKNKLSPGMIDALIREFREDMLSKGKQYADFALAFQNYMRKGWLSKKLPECVLKQQTHMDNRGVTL